MKQHILTTITSNTTQKVGHDNKFHTVYIIEFSTGHFYIGKHTTSNLDTDSYFCSGKLAISMKQAGHTYKRTILFYLDTALDAINVETLILSNTDIYKNEFCLNCYPGSPPDPSGSIIISLGNKFKMISPKLLEVYLLKGWIQKGITRCWVSKNDDIKFILPAEVDTYLDDGWILGNDKSRNRIFVTKDGVLKYIKRSSLLNFENDGWTKTHNVQNRKVLRKDNVVIKVHPDQVNDKLAEGFTPSSTIAELIYIYKGSEYKRVNEQDLSYYIDTGWKRGNNHTGKVYINNGIIETRIHKSDINEHPGFIFGRLEKLYLNNGKTEKRISILNTSLIQEYLNNNYVYGKLKRPKKVKIYKDKHTKQVLISELEFYLESGWSNKFDPCVNFHPRLKNYSV